jgi:8-oxo-dGTP diphosphatase
MGTAEYTHVTATLGLIFQDRRLLLLKRSTQPQVWAPPGGRLLRDENPIQGLQREVREECGIQIEVVMPTDTWFGPHDGSLTLGILYVCRYISGRVVLSPEHSDASWFSEEILKERMENSPADFFSNLGMYQHAFFLANLYQQRDAPG